MSQQDHNSTFVHVEVVPEMESDGHEFIQVNGVKDTELVDPSWPTEINAPVKDQGPQPEPGTETHALITIRDSTDFPVHVVVTLTRLQHMNWNTGSYLSGGSSYYTAYVSKVHDVEDCTSTEERSFYTKYFSGQEYTQRTGHINKAVSSMEEVDPNTASKVARIAGEQDTKPETLKIRGHIREEKIQDTNNQLSSNMTNTNNTIVHTLVIDEILHE